MTNRVPEQYENQRVGVQGYRVLNLDLDGVCADYNAGVKEYCVRHGLMSASVTPPMHTYALWENEGWPFHNLQEYIEIHKAAALEGLYENLLALPGVTQALHRLAHEHVYIRIVTHRLFVSDQHERVVQDTARWLEKHRIPYMSLCFAGLKDSIAATVHIDDSSANIDVLRAAGQQVVVFEQDYNRDCTGPRIRDWSDKSVDYMLELFEKNEK